MKTLKNTLSKKWIKQEDELQFLNDIIIGLESVHLSNPEDINEVKQSSAYVFLRTKADEITKNQLFVEKIIRLNEIRALKMKGE